MSYLENRATKPINTDLIQLGKSTITLLSCDYRPDRTNKESWQKIESQVESCSMVFVEYFPPELETTIYQIRLVGQYARRMGEHGGINSFFNRVASLAARYRKDVAVADMANKAIYVVYHAGFMFASLIPALAATANEWTKPLVLPLSFAALFLTKYALDTTEFERPDTSEKYILNMIDARRVSTAESLIRATQEQPDSTLLYIATHAHVKRVRNYLEHPENLSNRIKSKVYSLLPGLDKETRVYRHNPEGDKWTKISPLS